MTASIILLTGLGLLALAGVFALQNIQEQKKIIRRKIKNLEGKVFYHVPTDELVIQWSTGEVESIHGNSISKMPPLGKTSNFIYVGKY